MIGCLNSLLPELNKPFSIEMTEVYIRSPGFLANLTGNQYQLTFTGLKANL